MSQGKCHACGADFVKAMNAPDPFAKPSGDAVVAGMAGFVAGIEGGIAPLNTCEKCGKITCRSCARRAAVKRALPGHACAACAEPIGAGGVKGLDLGLAFARAIGDRKGSEMNDLLKKAEALTSPPDAVVVAMQGVFEGSLWVRVGGSDSYQCDVARQLGVWGAAAKSAEPALQRALTHMKSVNTASLSPAMSGEVVRVEQMMRFAIERIRGNPAAAVAILARAWSPADMSCVFMFVLEEIGDDAVHGLPALTKFLESVWAPGLLGRMFRGTDADPHMTGYRRGLMVDSALRTLERLAVSHEPAMQWLERAASGKRMNEEVRKICAGHVAAAKAKRAG